MSLPEISLESLARRAREDAALEAALERRERGQSLPGDEALLDRLPAFLLPSPSADRTQRLVASIQARFDSEQGDFLPSSRTSRKPVLRPPVAWTTAAALGVVAMAASALLWIRTPRDAEELARYEVRVEGSRQSERSNPKPPLVLRLGSDSELQFVLRPDTNVHGTVRARLFSQGADHSNGVEWVTRQEQSATGALRIQATLPAALPESGELILVIGRPEAVSELGASHRFEFMTSSVQVFRWPFERAF